MNAEQIVGNESHHELESKRRVSERLVLTKGALSKFVSRYLDGQLTGSELQQFGDQLEGEPVDYDDESPERVIAQVLFEMSAPEVNGEIDVAAARRWLAMLSE